MEQAQKILGKIKAMLLSLGFREVIVTNEYRSEKNYVYSTLYCIPYYIGKIGFLIVYADSIEAAKKYWHEDGEAFPLEMGEDAILTGLREEVLAEMKKLQA